MATAHIGGEERLEHCLKKVLRGQGVPPFAQHAQELVECSLDPELGSAHLAQVVLKDLGLTSQLLRVVNSSFYNRSGRRILNVAHAISLLGWETVRTLLMGMRYVEHYVRCSPGLRELMTSSLLTAAHVQQAALLVGYARPEEAYVCGLFRNLGEVLMARYYGREYSDVLLAMEEEHLPRRAAAMRVFRFDFDDLGPGIAEAWNLPAQVCLCAGGGRNAGRIEDRCLVSLVNFGHEVTASLYRNPEGVEAEMPRAVVTPTGRIYKIAERDLSQIVECAAADTKHIVAVLQVPMASLRLEVQAEQARSILNAPRVVCDVGKLASAIRDAEHVFDAPGFEPGAVIQQLLDALIGNGGFERAMFALMSEDGKTVRGRLSSGEDRESALAAFRFSLQDGDPLLNACVERRQDLWINRETDLRFEGSRVFAVLDPEHAAVFPVVVDDVVAGIVYADRSRPLTEELRGPAAHVRGAIAMAIARARSAANAPGGSAIGANHGWV